MSVIRSHNLLLLHLLVRWSSPGLPRHTEDTCNSVNSPGPMPPVHCHLCVLSLSMPQFPTCDWMGQSLGVLSAVSGLWHGELGCIRAIHRDYPEGAQWSNWEVSTGAQGGLPKYQGATQDLGRKGPLMPGVRSQI